MAMKLTITESTFTVRYHTCHACAAAGRDGAIVRPRRHGTVLELLDRPPRLEDHERVLGQRRCATVIG